MTQKGTIVDEESLIAVWKYANDSMETYEDWINYLSVLPDETSFNQYVIYNIHRTIRKWYETGKIKSFNDVNKYLTELKQEVKEDSLYWPEIKTYFNIKKKSDINNIDLSAYKFD